MNRIGLTIFITIIFLSISTNITFDGRSLFTNLTGIDNNDSPFEILYPCFAHNSSIGKQMLASDDRTIRSYVCH